MFLRKRYLPHDPQLDKLSSSSAANTEPMRRNARIDNPSLGKADENLDDNSSGFDSAISSNQVRSFTLVFLEKLHHD